MKKKKIIITLGYLWVLFSTALTLSLLYSSLLYIIVYLVLLCINGRFLALSLYWLVLYSWVLPVAPHQGAYALHGLLGSPGRFSTLLGIPLCIR